VNDLNQRLIDVLAGVEQRAIDDAISWPVVQTYPCLHSS